MAIEGLLRSQSNEIYLAIKKSGWNIADFEWTNERNLELRRSLSPTLRHKQSKYYFIIGASNGMYVSGQYSPGKDKIIQSYSVEWKPFLQIFINWLEYLKREVNVPDLWNDLPNELQLIESTTDDSDNTPFNDEEKALITKGLEEIKQFLLTAHNADAKFLEGQLRYLVESADRLGRKDWKNILIATILSIIIQGGIAGHSAQEIFNFVWTILSAVLVQKVYLPGL